MNEHSKVAAIVALMLTVLALTACGTQTVTTPAPEPAILLDTPRGINDQATAYVALTQEKNNANSQAIATAEIVRGNAQATLDSANATLRAVQTQNQSNANVISAQIAATSAIVRANAQATLNSASSTRSAALTEDAIQQTQMADQATTNAEAIVNQQNKDELSADTQTAVANNIATQTQVAVATSQWYTDQARQRAEQRAGPISFLWMWCLPVFIVLFAGLCLWGFWRWLRLRQNRQRISVRSIEILPSPPISGESQDKFIQSGGDNVNNRNELTKPDDQINRWLDEIKSKLLKSEKKDEDDHTGH